MNQSNKKYKFAHFELVIIIAFWLLLFASPLLFGRFEKEIEWSHIINVWIGFLPLLGLFLINRFILLPKFFFNGKRVLYFIITSSIIVISSMVFYSFENNLNNHQPPPPGAEGTIEVAPPIDHRELPPPNQRLNNPKPIPKFANFLILAILLVGFDMGLQISMRWAKLEQEKSNLQKENIENQLAFLKNQISPHFFMNTLNNIHALVDINSDEAKSAIIRLSNLMRHLLYDSEDQLSPIKKEVEFIKSYIELMRLRFTDKVKINVEIPEKIPEKSIPPLLFTSLLENAFKHGISYNKDSFINIIISFEKDTLTFKINNSNHQQKLDKKASGIGIENTRKRLDLIYKNNYKLDIVDNEDEYAVNLDIPL